MPLVYETSWKCLECKATGTVTVPEGQQWDAALWAEVDQQHQAQAPECHAVDRWCFWITVPATAKEAPCPQL